MDGSTIFEVESADTYAGNPYSPAARDAVRQTLGRHLEPNTRIGLTHFALDYAMYIGAICGVLFLGPLWAKIVCSLLAGIKIANLGTLGHDAAHGNLVASSRLNTVLGVLCFLPGLYNYRLWLYDHHHVHHPNTNGDHEDSWKPFSKAQFDALPPLRRWKERLYRSSWGLGLAPYYIMERWTHVKFVPGGFLPKRFRASAWAYFALVVGYVVAFVGLLAAAPLYSHTGSVTAVVLGFVAPFYIWMTFFSFTVYVQHTHKRIPWFEGAVDRKTAMPQEVLSLHLDFPKPIKALMHNVYEHAAHHANVRIPFHRLADAQAELNALIGEHAVVQPFSFKWLHETLRDCRLYDYDNHQWLDFDGKPTGPINVSPAQHDAIARFGPGNAFVRQE
ncbi:MAG TPA: fatty acid desaturase [Caulobacteraceae bacterium]|nr:fatty acid desaturase [Caulobacteraceae bacterium]